MVVVIREKNLLSRLLYPNPVCLLTVKVENDTVAGVKTYDRNVMTMSWLTPIDNYGNFICSINKKRHSADLVLKARKFVLNVPVHGQESMILSVGSISGRLGDKFDILGLPATVPGSGVGVNIESPKSFQLNLVERSAQYSSGTIVSADSSVLLPAKNPPETARSLGRQQRRELEEQQENARLVAVEGVAGHIVCVVDGTIEVGNCGTDGGECDPARRSDKDSGGQLW
jgi:flavin reductase (DIM6/NTAB) family NADH-FMN oxidoreductase RutF